MSSGRTGRLRALRISSLVDPLLDRAGNSDGELSLGARRQDLAQRRVPRDLLRVGRGDGRPHFNQAAETLHGMRYAGAMRPQT